MRHDLEDSLWYATRVIGEAHGLTPRQWIEHALRVGHIKSAKQAWATLRKWGDAYDYGVAEDLGWRTRRGPRPGAATRRRGEPWTEALRHGRLRGHCLTVRGEPCLSATCPGCDLCRG